MELLGEKNKKIMFKFKKFYKKGKEKELKNCYIMKRNNTK
jgi:hypothetical protein